MYDHERDEDAEEEEDEHGVLHELDVVRVVETLKHACTIQNIWNQIDTSYVVKSHGYLDRAQP